MATTKKRDARRSVHQSGWITLDGGFAARPCQVLDMSTSGAKITVDDPSSITRLTRRCYALKTPSISGIVSAG